MDPVDALVVSIIVFLCTCIPLHVLRVVRVRQAIRAWVEDLDAAGAYGPILAAAMPESNGGRYRSSALGLLMRRGIVRGTASGRFYLEAAAGGTATPSLAFGGLNPCTNASTPFLP